MAKSKTVKRLVVKIGTGVLLGKDGKLNQDIFNNIAKQVTDIQNLGIRIQIAIVSSGAIQAGRESTLIQFKPPLKKNQLAGIGSRYLLKKWGDAFLINGYEISEVPITFGNWNVIGEKRSIRSNILTYLEYRIVPIINENDVVSDKEIKMMEKGISENDQLARMIAELIDADAILFVTEKGGVYENDPSCHDNPRFYTEIDVSTARRLISAPSNASLNGTGGIKPKLQQGLLCSKKGMRVAIAGIQNDAIYKFALGMPVGTTIGNSVKFH